MTKDYVEQRNGFFYVTGTRVSLDSLVYLLRAGASPESIRDEFEVLTLEEVFGALAFYLAHQHEVDAYLARQQERWAEIEGSAGPLEPGLRKRLERARKKLDVKTA